MEQCKECPREHNRLHRAIVAERLPVAFMYNCINVKMPFAIALGPRANMRIRPFAAFRVNRQNARMCNKQQN